MKKTISAVLFTALLLHARQQTPVVLSYEILKNGAGNNNNNNNVIIIVDGSTAIHLKDDCALPCKPNLRFGSSSKMNECLKTNCGRGTLLDHHHHYSSGKNNNNLDYYLEGEEYNNKVPEIIPVNGNDACVARCKRRLRFGPDRRRECIAECDREDGSSPEKSNFHDAGDGDDRRFDFAGDLDACVARCKRLRTSGDRQEQCIADCRTISDVFESPDSPLVVGALEENHQRRRRRPRPVVVRDSSGNVNDCVARCDRLRSSTRAQRQCIAECEEKKEEKDDSSYESPDNSDNTTRDEDDDNIRDACAARCTRLRSSTRVRERCIADCDDRADDVSPESSNVDDDECEARCKKLRFGPDRVQQCIEDCRHKDDDDDSRGRSSNLDEESSTNLDGEEKEYKGLDASGDVDDDVDACVARCKKLRFGPDRVQQCIEDCRHKDDDSRESSNLDADSFSLDSKEKEFQARVSLDDVDQCVARCKRLRTSRDRQEQCIADCHKGDDSLKSSYLDADSFSLDSKEKEFQARVSLDDVDQCVARCKRLRTSRDRQEQCIADCHKDDDSLKSSYLDADSDSLDSKEKEFQARVSLDDVDQCVARCKRLRTSRDRQEQCIADCHKDDDSLKSSKLDTEEKDYQGLVSSGDVDTCVARCKRLRTSRNRQEQCVADCHKDEFSLKSSNLDEEDEGKNVHTDTSGGISCVTRCQRLRFSRRKQDECIADCGRINGIDRDIDYGYFEASS